MYPAYCIQYRDIREFSGIHSKLLMTVQLRLDYFGTAVTADGFGCIRSSTWFRETVANVLA